MLELGGIRFLNMEGGVPALREIFREDGNLGYELVSSAAALCTLNAHIIIPTTQGRTLDP